MYHMTRRTDMRLATFNVENLFSRAKAMNLETWKQGKVILDDYSKFNSLLQNVTYTEEIKRSIILMLKKLDLMKKDESEFVILRQNRGKLLKRGKAGTEIVATGRSSWTGWLELREEAINERTIEMTAKVIKDIDADVLALVEAEDRIALRNFNDQVLKPLRAHYDHYMLIDGNDERGIDVGIMTKKTFPISNIVSHVDDRSGKKNVFSRDCPEYIVEVGNKELLVMVNHLKSKGFGKASESDAKRKLQAARIKEIYDLRRKQGIKNIAIVGDLNDTPDSRPLAPLLGSGSDLKDVFEHPKFDKGTREGTFGSCAKSNKIDYILLSPNLFGKLQGGGVNRMGIWGGKNGTLFPHYPELKGPEDSASDHAAIWCDINI